MAAGDKSYTAVVSAGGSAVVTIRPLKSVTWVISQISVEMVTAAGQSAGTCEVRKNGRLVTPLVATGDAATGDPPVTLWPTDQCTVTWSAATPGLVGTVLAFYDEVPYP